MSLSCTISNLQFDYAFLHAVKSASSGDIQNRHFNGIPLQNVLLFKTICVLPDEEINTKVVSEWHYRLFGIVISGTSTSRTIDAIVEYGLIDRVENPHVGSKKFSWIRLSQAGRKLQKLFIGSTSDWKDKPKVVLDRELKTASTKRWE